MTLGGRSALLSCALVACGGPDEPPLVAPPDAGDSVRDAGSEPDAFVPVGPAPDCSDPAIWRPPDVTVEVSAEPPGVCVSGGDHPVGAVSAAVRLPWEELQHFASFCWRVAAADERSGWAAGDPIADKGAWIAIYVRGHDLNVELEMRTFDLDGRLVGGRSEPVAVPAPGAREIPSPVVAVWGHARRVSYATQDEVHFAGGRTVPAIGRVFDFYAGAWLEDAGGSTLLRWLPEDDALPPGMLPIDVPTDSVRIAGQLERVVALATRDAILRVQLAGTTAVQLDDIPLAGPPDDAVVSIWAGLLVRSGTELRAYDLATGDERPVRIGPIHELLSPGAARTGRTFVTLGGDDVGGVVARSEEIVLSEEDLFALGEPLHVGQNGVWGRRGFVANGSADVEGERFASAEELYGGSIADVSGADYMGDVFAVVRPDGSASVMTAWTTGPCE